MTRNNNNTAAAMIHRMIGLRDAMGRAEGDGESETQRATEVVAAVVDEGAGASARTASVPPRSVNA